MTIDVASSVKKMFVGGKWIESESGQLFDATSPATGEVIARVSKGTREDAKRAVEAAHKARSSMAQLKGFERSKRLHRIAEAIAARRDELGHLLTLDQGKPLFAEALGEVDEAAEYFRIAAEDLKRLEGHVLPSASPSKLVLARHYPRGVYGVITPWNWPLTMAAELIAPALAAGNTVVWTPATSTSVISIAMMECIAEADFPAGTVNLVTGPGAEVGDEVAGHELVDGVAFVGSTETGASVARRAAGKHVMLELGGNGPMRTSAAPSRAPSSAATCARARAARQASESWSRNQCETSSSPGWSTQPRRCAWATRSRRGPRSAPSTTRASRPRWTSMWPTPWHMARR
jgi:acyl-CoA reductase-like NAD-dependent aldehyde dehydrogenase